MRQLTVEIIGDEITGKCAAWTLLASMLAWSRQDAAMGNAVFHCTKALSTTMIAGGTPMRQLILEIVTSEIAGECVAWLLSAAMLAQRQQGKATNVNGDHRVKALSTVMLKEAHR